MGKKTSKEKLFSRLGMVEPVPVAEYEDETERNSIHITIENRMVDGKKKRVIMVSCDDGIYMGRKMDQEFNDLESLGKFLEQKIEL